MNWFFSTLSKRIIFLFVMGIIIIQLTTFWFIESTLYQNNLKNNVLLPQKLATLYSVVNNTHDDLQAKTALDISSENFEVLVANTSISELINHKAEDDIKNEILKTLQDEKIEALFFGEIKNEPNSLGLSLQLKSKKWLNIYIHSHHKHRFVLENVIFYFVSITLLFILGVIILLRWLVKPLEDMAEAVSHFKNPNEKLEFQKGNTKEINLLGSSINHMQSRMLQLLEQRTYALAAISHDLKTPLTRMRMRIEILKEKKLQNSFAQDLTEMEQMVDSTLYYLKSGGNEEEKQIVDLISILETIENELSDSGFKAVILNQYKGKTRIFGQHYALKRAFSNIIYNAIKYGDEAIITVSHVNDAVVISIEDKGNGIDPALFEKVLEPFVRLEQSRNFNTGGFGLGLTIAKTIIENHKGHLNLSLNESHSLKVDISLPLHIKKP